MIFFILSKRSPKSTRHTLVLKVELLIGIVFLLLLLKSMLMSLWYRIAPMEQWEQEEVSQALIQLKQNSFSGNHTDSAAIALEIYDLLTHGFIESLHLTGLRVHIVKEERPENERSGCRGYFQIPRLSKYSLLTRKELGKTLLHLLTTQCPQRPSRIFILDGKQKFKTIGYTLTKNQPLHIRVGEFHKTYIFHYL